MLDILEPEARRINILAKWPASWCAATAATTKLLYLVSEVKEMNRHNGTHTTGHHHASMPFEADIQAFILSYSSKYLYFYLIM